MNYKKKILLELLAGSILVCNLLAYDLNEIISSDIKEKISQNNKIYLNHFDKSIENLKLVPNTKLSKENAYNWELNENPNFMSEFIYCEKKQNINENFNINLASEILCSISKIKGTKYYSNSSKREEVLYKEAYCINNPEEKLVVEDAKFNNNDELIQYCVLNDNSLGKCIYEIKYKKNDNELSVNFVNITPIKIGPIKAVDKRNLQITLNLIDCGEDFIVYMNTKSKYPNIPLIQNKLVKSFTARVDAIFYWFINNLRL